jgi:hypothetical protein
MLTLPWYHGTNLRSYVFNMWPAVPLELFWVIDSCLAIYNANPNPHPNPNPNR